MPVFKPLPGITRTQKFFPWAVGLLGIALALDIGATAVVFSTGGTSVFSDDLGADDWLQFFGVLTFFIACLTSLILAILDTAAHDHEFNVPWFLGFMACCIPLVNLILPFALYSQVIGVNTWAAGISDKKAKVLLWLWFGVHAMSLVVSIGMNFEIISNENWQSPVGSLLESGLTALSDVVGIFALGAICESVVLARKAVIRRAANAPQPVLDPYTGLPVSGGKNDPFWPGI